MTRGTIRLLAIAIIAVLAHPSRAEATLLLIAAAAILPRIKNLRQSA